jgi:hypothetical protein
MCRCFAPGQRSLSPFSAFFHAFWLPARIITVANPTNRINNNILGHDKQDCA